MGLMLLTSLSTFASSKVEISFLCGDDANSVSLPEIERVYSQGPQLIQTDIQVIGSSLYSLSKSLASKKLEDLAFYYPTVVAMKEIGNCTKTIKIDGTQEELEYSRDALEYAVRNVYSTLEAYASQSAIHYYTHFPVQTPTSRTDNYEHEEVMKLHVKGSKSMTKWISERTTFQSNVEEINGKNNFKGKITLEIVK